MGVCVVAPLASLGLAVGVTGLTSWRRGRGALVLASMASLGWATLMTVSGWMKWGRFLVVLPRVRIPGRGPGVPHDVVWDLVVVPPLLVAAIVVHQVLASVGLFGISLCFTA